MNNIYNGLYNDEIDNDALNEFLETDEKNIKFEADFIARDTELAKPELLRHDVFDDDIDRDPNLLDSSFYTNNVMTAALNQDPNFEDDNDWKRNGGAASYNWNAKYGTDAHIFLNSNSPEHASFLMAKYEQEHIYKQKIVDEGALGVVASLVADVFDPVTFIPFIGQGYKGIRAARIAQGFIKNAGVTAAAEIGREAILHKTQVTRTLKESVFNIGSASVMVGSIGAAIGGFSKSYTKEMAQKVVDDVLIDGPADEIVLIESKSSNSVGAASTPAELLEFERTKYEAADKAIVSKGLSPLHRLSTSEFTTSQKYSFKINNGAIIRKGHKSGILDEGDVQNAIRIKERDSNLLFNDVSKEHSKYVERTSKNDRLTPEQFRHEISHAMRRGDVSDIPEVASAARKARKYVDNILKEAQELGLIEKGVVAKWAMSYLPRVYDIPFIKQNLDEFKILLRKSLVNSNIDEEYIDDAVQGIYNNIIGNKINIFEGTSAARAAPSKDRVLELSDEFLEKFLISDFDYLINSYSKSLVPKIELVKKIGDVDGKLYKEELLIEFNEIQNTTKYKTDLKYQNKVNKQFHRDQTLIDDMITQVQGKPLHTWELDSKAYKSIKLLKAFNNVTKLGGVVISSIPDMARLVMSHGFRDSAVAIFKIVTLNDVSKLARKDLEELIVGTDLAQTAMARFSADLEYHIPVPTDNFNRIVDNVTTKAFNLTGLPAWNRTFKTTSAVLTSQRIYEAAIELRKTGKLTTPKLKRLYSIGLSDDLIRRAGKMVDETADTKLDGMVFLNQKKWTDIEAAGKIEEAILREANNTLITPGAGELHAWFHHPVGGLMLQYKSFLSLAHDRILIAGLQQNDADAYMSMVSLIALGAMSVQIKLALKGKPLIERPEELLLEAIDQSGVLALFTESNNLLDKWSNHDISVNALIGGQESRRFASRDKLSALLGPSYQTGNAVLQFANNLFGGVDSGASRRLKKKLIPLNNHFIITGILNHVDRTKDYYEGR